ncbi:MAG: hypothetical protein AB7E12_13520 [Burkholderiaceae bacterium]
MTPRILNFTDARKRFAEDRRRLIYQGLDGLALSEQQRSDLANRIAQSIGNHEAHQFNSRGEWVGHGQTDC